MSSDEPRRSLANAAVMFHPDSHVADRPKIMGRHSAGAGFLNAFAAHAQVDQFQFYLQEQAHLAALQAQLAKTPGKRRAQAIYPGQEERLAAVGCLLLPDPEMGDKAWERRILGDRAYSLCGLTHTISSRAVLDRIGDFLVAPLQPWDALICTSRVVRAEIEAVLERHADYLHRRTGGRPRPQVQLPVIPLGVDCRRFEADARMRSQLRANIGAADGDLVVLFLGRLSFHAKANPLPLVLAADRAAQRISGKVHVLFVGQFVSPGLERSFRAAAALAQTAQVHFRSGAEPAMAAAAWRAADVFASLSDNVQESFGLSVIEAMAAGLPVIASDWDGYRDTVQHGVTGFLAPTVMAPPGTGADLAQRHFQRTDSYDQYIGAVSLCTAVDVEAAAGMLVLLAEQPDLRVRMGAAGRQAAVTRYDWRHVVRAYQELWAELRDIRETAPGSGVREGGEPAHPVHRDPFELFSAHPTGALHESATIRIDDGSGLERLLALKAASYAIEGLLLPRDAIQALAGRLADAPQSVGALLGAVPPDERPALLRTLVWMMKFGIAAASA